MNGKLSCLFETHLFFLSPPQFCTVISAINWAKGSFNIAQYWFSNTHNIPRLSRKGPSYFHGTDIVVNGTDRVVDALHQYTKLSLVVPRDVHIRMCSTSKWSFIACLSGLRIILHSWPSTTELMWKTNRQLAKRYLLSKQNINLFKLHTLNLKRLIRLMQWPIWSQGRNKTDSHLIKLCYRTGP